MIDIRQTQNYANYLKKQGWIVKRIDNVNFFIKKIPFFNVSILKLQRPDKLELSVIGKLQRKYRVFQTIVEPKDTNQAQKLVKNRYKLNKSPYLPTKTIQINLEESEKSIYKEFSKNCKYSIKRGSSLKIKECSTPNEIKSFREAWKRSVNMDRYVPSLDTLLNIKKSFPQSHSTILTSHNIFSSIIGGALFTRSSHSFGYYWFGFTNKEGRSSLSQYSLLYHGILWAKKCGCKSFDMEGIYDKRFPNKSWLGFTHFKKQFGGVEISYPGCYIKTKFLKIFS